MINRLYIECTHTAETGLNTGIQRVVRKIINQLGSELPDGTPITLVSIHDGIFYSLAELPDYREIKKDSLIDSAPLLLPTQSLKNKVIHFLRRIRMTIVNNIQWKPLHNFLAAPRSAFGLSRIIYFLTLQPYRYMKFQAALNLDESVQAIEFVQGDVILMLDSSWHLPAWEALAKAKEKGVIVISVIYDLIPITHPQFCEASLGKVFSTWFEKASDKVDGYIAISQTVRETLQRYLISQGANFDSQRLGFFYLGADIATTTEYARTELKNTISKKDSYLIVSTIEPRKNHQYLLDVFTRLWKEGYFVKLHIVGRIGWKVDELLTQIEQHPEFNKKLFIWHDLDDAELVYCYKHSKALVFPSYVEGFGLPIIEAQHHHLPVLASDTPIHREVGGESVIYFDINKKQDQNLVRKIAQIEMGNLQLKEGAKFQLEQFTWQQSAETLCHEIQRIAADIKTP